MINPPPKTGDARLDTFLTDIYEKSLELSNKAKPDIGWSLTDFTADVSGVIGDKRDLIDIVTQYDSIDNLMGMIADQRGLLDKALEEAEKIGEHADWFATIMEWWDQNYKAIVDAQTSLYYKIEAEESALEAKQHAEKTEQDIVETGKNLADAREAASDAQMYRQGALTYREGAKEHREASEAAKALSEAAQALAEQFRDGAKAHREAAKVSETNAAASASAASTDANKSAGSATEAAGEVTKAEAARVQVEAVEAALRALMADTEAWQDVSFALESVDSRISTGMEAVKNDILGGVGPAFDTLLELAEALGENADAIGTLTNELAKKADKGHTHTSADITDSVGYMGSPGYADRLVRTGSTGQIHVGTMPSEDNHLTRKGYVDGEVAKKANTSHTHTISDTSGLQTALDGKAPESHIHSIADVDGLDAALAAHAAEGHTHTSADITDAVSAAALTSTRANKVVKTGADGMLHSEAYPRENTHLVHKGHLDSEVGKKADTGHTHVSADITDATSVPGYSSSANKVVKTGDDGHIYFNQSPTKWQHIANKEYVDEQVAKKASTSHKHNLADITDLPSIQDSIWSSLTPGILLKTGSDGYLHMTQTPSDGNHLANKRYVDTELAKKANSTHTHTLSDISGVPSSASTSAASDSFVIRNSSGLFSVKTPTSNSHPTNKAYVDTEVGKKANSSHKHATADISDATAYSDGSGQGNRLMKTNADGSFTIATSTITTNSRITNKAYVDARPALFSGAGNPPSTISGAVVGDWWLNTTTMELFKITGV